MTGLPNRLSVIIGESGVSGVPPWAWDLAVLGSWLGEWGPREVIPVVVVGLPGLPFASGLVAAGVVTTRAKVPRGGAGDPDDHWDQIVSLDPGSPVYLRLGSRVLDGIVQGSRRIAGEIRVAIEVENEKGGRTTRLIPLRGIQDVKVAPHPVTLPARQKGKKLPGVSPFVKAWFGLELGRSHVQDRRTNVIIVGSRARISRELSDRSLLFHHNGSGEIRGTLGEILRPRDSTPKREGFASRLLSARNSATEKPWLPRESVLVFDGAAAFLRARPRLMNRPTMVVLARGEARFSDALEVLHQVAARSNQPLAPPVPRSAAIEMFSVSIPVSGA